MRLSHAVSWGVPGDPWGSMGFLDQVPWGVPGVFVSAAPWKPCGSGLLPADTSTPALCGVPWGSMGFHGVPWGFFIRFPGLSLLKGLAVHGWVVTPGRLTQSVNCLE